MFAWYRFILAAVVCQLAVQPGAAQVPINEVGNAGSVVQDARQWAVALATSGSGNPMNPDAASEAVVDRFAGGTGTLFVRDAINGLPEAGEPIDFDEGPFITRGLGPDGQSVRYYNFDVMPRETAPIFALFREGEDAPVEGQLNVVGVIPGDEGYSDFWHVHKVIVPATYVANVLTSVEAIMASGYAIERLNLVVNCPVVPDGSTAELRLAEGNGSGLIRGWYEDQVIFYFDFSERMLVVEIPDEGPAIVPVSPIYVAFNINPGEEGGGPSSGFVTEDGTDQTHNVVATLPQNEAYSPLWSVNPYDNRDFDTVHDLSSAASATILGTGVALVNCPVVTVASNVSVEPRSGEVPARIDLLGNYPNPFNPETTVEYVLDNAGSVTLRIFDPLGRHVIDLVNSRQAPGVHRITWDGRDANGQEVASGVYLYRVVLDGHASGARSMLMLK
ncbi:MAG TPA: FlgD immunoglobulin-like domain containing protein [Rhodothermales bacterium]|nr:FlgD immunoglobulin-like domain containing protein [Rhodothermales bacterium]